MASAPTSGVSPRARPGASAPSESVRKPSGSSPRSAPTPTRRPRQSCWAVTARTGRSGPARCPRESPRRRHHRDRGLAGRSAPRAGRAAPRRDRRGQLPVPGLPSDARGAVTNDERLAHADPTVRIDPTPENGMSAVSWALSHHVNSVALRKVQSTASRVTTDQLGQIRQRIALAVSVSSGRSWPLCGQRVAVRVSEGGSLCGGAVPRARDIAPRSPPRGPARRRGLTAARRPPPTEQESRARRCRRRRR